MARSVGTCVLCMEVYCVRKCTVLRGVLSALRTTAQGRINARAAHTCMSATHLHTTKCALPIATPTREHSRRTGARSDWSMEKPVSIQATRQWANDGRLDAPAQHSRSGSSVERCWTP